MLTRSVVAFALLTLALGSPAAAQTRLGLGIGLAPGALLGTASPHVYVPITTGSFRIEPGFALLGIASREEAPWGDSETALRGLRVDLGLLFDFAQEGGTHLYAGPRVGLIRLRSSDRFDTQPEMTTTQNVITIAGALGAEHFIGSRFSVGGEAQLGYGSVRDPERTPAQGPGAERTSTGSIWATNALFFFRWYFSSGD
jgi:hypothetical protein